nr:MAG TPA: hypothetical protein [Caudoviricetes sp.]
MPSVPTAQRFRGLEQRFLNECRFFRGIFGCARLVIAP